MKNYKYEIVNLDGSLVQPFESLEPAKLALSKMRTKRVIIETYQRNKFWRAGLEVCRNF